MSKDFGFEKLFFLDSREENDKTVVGVTDGSDKKFYLDFLSEDIESIDEYTFIKIIANKDTKVTLEKWNMDEGKVEYLNYDMQKDEEVILDYDTELILLNGIVIKG